MPRISFALAGQPFCCFPGRIFERIAGLKQFIFAHGFSFAPVRRQRIAACSGATMPSALLLTSECLRCLGELVPG
jgi:hypothetical protein